MKISVTLIDDNTDNPEYCAFQFRFESDDCLHSTIFIEDPFIRSKNEWRQLAEAIEDNKKYRLDLTKKDGFAAIRCDCKRVIFEVMLSGNNVKITTTVPIELYKSQISACFRAILEDQSLGAFWK